MSQTSAFPSVCPTPSQPPHERKVSRVRRASFAALATGASLLFACAPGAWMASPIAAPSPARTATVAPPRAPSAEVPALPVGLYPKPLAVIPTPTTPTVPFIVEAAPTLEQDVLRWTNVERLAAGRRPLAWSETLAKAARGHSEEMARRGYFAHESPEPARRTAMMRARLAGLVGGPTTLVGENLFRGNWRRDRARRIVAAWMGSPGHRANLLRAEFEYLGVGLAWDRDYAVVTQVFSLTE